MFSFFKGSKLSSGIESVREVSQQYRKADRARDEARIELMQLISETILKFHASKDPDDTRGELVKLISLYTFSLVVIKEENRDHEVMKMIKSEIDNIGSKLDELFAKNESMKELSDKVTEYRRDIKYDELT